MYEYTVSKDTVRDGVRVTVQLEPRQRDGTYHKQLAVALLDVLNDDHFRATPYNAAYGSEVDVSFHAPGNEVTTYIHGRFRLGQADHAEIQNLADRAQQHLTRRMTEAVDVFNVMLAVSTVDPYKARLSRWVDLRAVGKGAARGSA